MNPLNSIKGTIAAGVVVSIVIAALIQGFGFSHAMLDRWLHILSGVLWIGLLWYFNFVQVPALAQAAADQGGPGGAGISKYVAPLALLWFRWAALVTWLSGAYYLMVNNNLLGVFTFGAMPAASGQIYAVVMGLGAWMGTIMLFNVWVLIWPNQKKVLGIVQASDEEKAKSRRVAFLASRANTFLSIPMLMCMGGAAHQLPF